MPSGKLLQRTALALTLSSFALLGQTAQAQEFDNRPNAYLGASQYVFDDDWNTENDTGWAFGAEAPATERFSVAFEYWDHTAKYEPMPLYANTSLFRVGTNYHLPKMESWQPYLSAGLGNHKYELDGSGSNNNTAFDFGVGVKKSLTDNIFMRGDLKLLKVTNVSNLDMVANLTVGYAFGRPARPVATTPVDRQAPPAAPMDSDGDGVNDNNDRCANTPRNLVVDDNGCPVMEERMLSQELLVNFDFDKSEIKTQYEPEIEEFADFLATYSNTNIVIEGHTDNVGSNEYNQALSERRANAVRARLINVHGIDPGRIRTVGYGEERPLVANDTPANRARNRRIMADVSVRIEEPRER